MAQMLGVLAKEFRFVDNFFHQPLAKAKESEAHGKNAEVDDGLKLKLAAVVAYF